MAKQKTSKKRQTKINEAKEVKKVFMITGIIVLALLLIIFVFFFNR